MRGQSVVENLKEGSKFQLVWGPQNWVSGHFQAEGAVWPNVFLKLCRLWSYPYSWFGDCRTGASYLKYYPEHSFWSMQLGIPSESVVLQYTWGASSSVCCFGAPAVWFYCMGIHLYVWVNMHSVASYPGLLAPAFVACSTNIGEGLVKLSHVVWCTWTLWRSGTFPENQQVSECATNCKHGP